jgi:hypothetical protein
MATAEQYAQWIVDNQDKKGTPEFDTVASAYKIAKGTPETNQEAPQAIAEVKPAADTGYKAKLAQGASKMLQGLLSGGPLGAMLSGVNEATSTANDAVTKGAYEAGGKVTDVAAKVLPPEGAAAVGYAANVGLQAIPALLAGKVGTKVAPQMEEGGRRLMQSALKPPLEELKNGKAAKAIETLLKDGVNVSPGGVRVLRERIDELNRQIAYEIRNSTATVDKMKVYGPIKEALDTFKMAANPNNDVATIKAAWNEFLNHPMITAQEPAANASWAAWQQYLNNKDSTQFPVQIAQEMKRATNRSLGSKSYGELKGAEKESQKAIVRGLKDQIAEGVPGISNLNAKDSELLNALSLTERRVLLSLNKNPNGLSLLTGSPQAWAAFMADKSELFKSAVARMMYSGSERIPQAAVGTATAVLNQPRQ